MRSPIASTQSSCLEPLCTCNVPPQFMTGCALQEVEQLQANGQSLEDTDMYGREGLRVGGGGGEYQCYWVQNSTFVSELTWATHWFLGEQLLTLQTSKREIGRTKTTWPQLCVSALCIGKP